MKYSNGVLLIFWICLVACTNISKDLLEIDLESWKQDKYGCKDYRISKEELITNNKDNLISLSEKEISELLGLPETTELINRSEKYYNYSLAGSKHCDSSRNSVHKYLRIRFNSLGYAKEVLILSDKL
ncbi:MAG: hypothetical protein JXQ96_01380 [Cyclobacteriaceae bacterium]